MHFTLALLGLASSVAAQAVTAIIPPSTQAPSGCLNSRQGSFELQLYKVGNTGKREEAALQPRQTNLEMTLLGGVLTDAAGRTGYIASNFQFQFDKPPQAGAIYTSGWSICPNGSIALGNQLVFWQCKSGGFYNLYNKDFAPANCMPVTFNSASGAGQDFSSTVTRLGGATASSPAGSAGSTAPAATGSMSMTMSSPAAATTPASNATMTQMSSAMSSMSMSMSSSVAANPSPSAGGAAALASVAPQALFAGALGVLGAFALA